MDNVTNAQNLEKNKPYKKFKKNNLVVQDNMLITATYKMNRNELLAFKQIISQVNTKNKSKIVQITKGDIIKFIFPNAQKVKSHSIDSKYYQVCKKYYLSLIETSIMINQLSKNIISDVHWESDSNIVTIKFSDDIMPFIYGLKKNFTKYQIGYLVKLKSKYSILLYEYYKMHSYNKKGNCSWNESVNNIRNMLNIKTKYKEYSLFNQDILKNSQQQINEHTDIHIEYKALKNTADGKIVTDIKFTVTQKKKPIQQTTIPPEKLSIPNAGPGRDFLEAIAAKKQKTVEEIVKIKSITITIEESPKTESQQPVKTPDKAPIKKPSIWNKFKSIFKH
ncbi:hypothetical protein AZF37_09790 (plasmid) [endosymbiont 'TC1' of Trimyema compressum]|uniref:replication initiation protein n=1 Tax=endosymbiont 'TC1' of Trimyema compressum TaxID=243899 RepID=UPI0007F0FA05|nr:replication initiation protein [endosymbiont 'TC1' of Trimyema compressum]AMP21465.1 hypothetical protein AZF37_09790 [endosymbiont 'TC1' of Trimyema compressum]